MNKLNTPDSKKGNLFESVLRFPANSYSRRHAYVQNILWDSNIVAISSALLILKVQCEFTQYQGEEGARDVNDICPQWLKGTLANVKLIIRQEDGRSRKMNSWRFIFNRLDRSQEKFKINLLVINMVLDGPDNFKSGIKPYLFACLLFYIFCIPFRILSQMYRKYQKFQELPPLIMVF